MRTEIIQQSQEAKWGRSSLRKRQNLALFFQAFSLDIIKTIQAVKVSKENAIYLKEDAISSVETAVMRIIWLH